MDIELRHLRYFLAVAEKLHFGRAAAAIGIAQPALSQQIRRLERELGTELFLRTTRSVELTTAGDALRNHAQRALAEVDVGKVAALRGARGEIGNLTIGFIETAAVTLIPGAVRGFRASRPEVALTLRELSVDAQVDGLRSGELDVAIVRPPIDSIGLMVEKVADERLIASIPTGHPLATRKRIPISALVGQPLVALSRDVVPGLHDQVISLLGERDGTARITQEASSIQAVLGLVAAGLGIAVLPSSVRMLSREGVAFVALQSAPRSTMLMAWRRDDESPLVKAFVAVALRQRPAG